MNLPRLHLTLDDHPILAHVARSDEDRAQGLQHCTSLAEDEGMLFVHDAPLRACFWMQDTPLPLSIAFIDEGGRVLNVDEMQPQSQRAVCAADEVRFVLEMNSGWFRERGIGRGSQLLGLPQLAVRQGRQA